MQTLDSKIVAAKQAKESVVLLLDAANLNDWHQVPTGIIDLKDEWHLKASLCDLVAIEYQGEYIILQDKIGTATDLTIKILGA